MVLISRCVRESDERWVGLAEVETTRRIGARETWMSLHSLDLRSVMPTCMSRSLWGALRWILSTGHVLMKTAFGRKSSFLSLYFTPFRTDINMCYCRRNTSAHHISHHQEWNQLESLSLCIAWLMQHKEEIGPAKWLETRLKHAGLFVREIPQNHVSFSRSFL